MKTTFLKISVSILGLFIFLTACNKDDESNNELLKKLETVKFYKEGDQDTISFRYNYNNSGLIERIDLKKINQIITILYNTNNTVSEIDLLPQKYVFSYENNSKVPNKITFINETSNFSSDVSYTNGILSWKDKQNTSYSLENVNFETNSFSKYIFSNSQEYSFFYSNNLKNGLNAKTDNINIPIAMSGLGIELSFSGVHLHSLPINKIEAPNTTYLFEYENDTDNYVKKRVVNINGAKYITDYTYK